MLVTQEERKREGIFKKVLKNIIILVLVNVLWLDYCLSLVLFPVLSGELVVEIMQASSLPVNPNVAAAGQRTGAQEIMESR